MGTTAEARDDLTAQDLPELVSARQAGHIVGVSKWTIFRYIEAGQITGRKVDGDWILVQPEVERFARRRNRPITSPTLDGTPISSSQEDAA